MKCSYLTGLFLAAMLLLGGKVFAQSFFVNITVDENGNGTLFNPVIGTSIPLSSALQSDPGPGGLPAVLTYDLLGAPGLVAGDVLLQDGVGGPISDVIRFNPAGTGGDPNYSESLVFYSDDVDGFDSLADTGLPAIFYAN
jgi:hypothetical protein